MMIMMLIIFVCLIIVIVSNIRSKTQHFHDDHYKTSIISTIKDKSNIPDHIYTNRNRYACRYNHTVFDDDDCVHFLNTHYGKSYSDKFTNISNGAHKADLFRYAYLYIKGGLYVDIKTIFIKDLDSVIRDKDISYFIITKSNNRSNGNLYNGIIYTPPRNKLILDMLNHAMKIKDNDDYFFNLIFGTKQIQSYLKTSNNQINGGMNLTNDVVPNIRIYYEKLFPKEKCNNKLDRYGICSFIVDEWNNILFKTRDSKYTPNYV